MLRKTLSNPKDDERLYMCAVVVRAVMVIEPRLAGANSDILISRPRGIPVFSLVRQGQGTRYTLRYWSMRP